MYRDRDVSIRFIKMLTQEVHEKEKQLLDLALDPFASGWPRHCSGSATGSAGTIRHLGVRISREDLATIVGAATESPGSVRSPTCAGKA